MDWYNKIKKVMPIKNIENIFDKSKKMISKLNNKKAKTIKFNLGNSQSLTVQCLCLSNGNKVTDIKKNVNKKNIISTLFKVCLLKIKLLKY